MSMNAYIMVLSKLMDDIDGRMDSGNQETMLVLRLTIVGNVLTLITTITGVVMTAFEFPRAESGPMRPTVLTSTHAKPSDLVVGENQEQSDYFVQQYERQNSVGILIRSHKEARKLVGIFFTRIASVPVKIGRAHV